MPIKGLTDRQASFPQIGVLRKGEEKTGNKPGADLKHFRFDADEATTKTFEEAYGKEPRAIRVFVPFATTDENFEAWKEEWVAGGLKHRCDGETCSLWLTPQGTYSTEPKKCPGGCKQAGRLKVVIPELKRLAYVTVLTTSKHDIMEIHANLSALEAARGSLVGIPLILRRVPREISTPTDDGKRVRREKWLINIEAQPQWVEMQLIAQEQQAIPVIGAAPAPLALPEYFEDEGETIDITPTDPLKAFREELYQEWVKAGQDAGGFDAKFDEVYGKCQTEAEARKLQADRKAEAKKGGK